MSERKSSSGGDVSEKKRCEDRGKKKGREGINISESLAAPDTQD